MDQTQEKEARRKRLTETQMEQNNIAKLDKQSRQNP